MLVRVGMSMGRVGGLRCSGATQEIPIRRGARRLGLSARSYEAVHLPRRNALGRLWPVSSNKSLCRDPGEKTLGLGGGRAFKKSGL